jgi:hypothetical protein
MDNLEIWPRFSTRLRFPLRIGTTLLLVAAFQSSFAAVYRCDSKNGTSTVSTFSTTPCGPDAVQSVLPDPIQTAIAPQASIVSTLPQQLAGNRECVRLNQIDNRQVPPELYDRVKICMQDNRDADAVALFAIAGMDSIFDSLRVTDRSAGQARDILVKELFESLPANTSARLQAEIKDLWEHSQRLASLCEQVKKIGPPQYFPTYMVNHGMAVVISDLSKQASLPPLKADFDSAATWNDIRTQYLNCNGPASDALPTKTHERQLPLVPERNMTYVIKFDDGGSIREVRTEYSCYLEDVSLTSARGAAWHVRFEGMLRAKGELKDGTPFEIQPTNTSYASFSEGAWCPDNDVPNSSVLFLRPYATSNLVEGFSSEHVASPSHVIRILDSRFKLNSTGQAVFRPLDTSANHVSPPPGPRYYTISAEILPGVEIDRRQLRAYVTQRQAIRLVPGHSYEFKEWGPEDRAAAIKYYGKLDPASTADFVNVGQKSSDEGWVIEPGTKKAIQWFLAANADYDILKVLRHPESIPREWVTYKQSRIQVPLEVYGSRHFYDPSSDELVILQVHHAELLPP